MKTAIVCFFSAFPAVSGSGVVIYDFFKSWPNKKKKLFQMSQNFSKAKKVDETYIIFNKPIFKIIFLPLMIFKILKFFKNEKKKVLILEGASWIFYSFFILIFFKIFFKKIFIIYRSHSIEYEIRKNNSNFLIIFITKFFEKIVYNYSDVVTNVSSIEKLKAHKFYKRETLIFPNSIRINYLKKIKEKPVNEISKKFILFCGSYSYKPNQQAIDFIIKKIIPIISQKNISLIITGHSNIKFKNVNVLNLGLVSKNELKFLYNNCICLFVPIFEGYGTRIKILEGLVLGSNILTTPKGIEGISYPLNSKRIYLANTKKKMITGINYFLQSKKRSSNLKMEYYSMEKNTKNLYREIIKSI
jgi:hypothetical protein